MCDASVLLPQSITCDTSQSPILDPIDAPSSAVIMNEIALKEFRLDHIHWRSLPESFI